MTAGPERAPAAPAYTKYNYPGYYQDRTSTPAAPAYDYTNRDQLQTCELVASADLNTGTPTYAPPSPLPQPPDTSA